MITKLIIELIVILVFLVAWIAAWTTIWIIANKKRKYILAFVASYLSISFLGLLIQTIIYLVKKPNADTIISTEKPPEKPIVYSIHGSFYLKQSNSDPIEISYEDYERMKKNN